MVLRQMRIPIFQSMIMNFANTMIRGNALEEQFKHKEVRRHWYYHWLGRCNHLKTANIRPLEITRAKWATAKNALDHYNLLADMMVQLGLAVRNTAFVEGEELSEPIKITKPGRIFSMDETRLTNDATTASKAKGNRTVIGTDGDCGEVIVNKGWGDGTGFGVARPRTGSTFRVSSSSPTTSYTPARTMRTWLRTTVHRVGGWRRRTPTTPASQCRVASGPMQRGASRSTSASATFKGAWNRASPTCRRKTRPCS